MKKYAVIIHRAVISRAYVTVETDCDDEGDIYDIAAEKADDKDLWYVVDVAIELPDDGPLHSGTYADSIKEV